MSIYPDSTSGPGFWGAYTGVVYHYATTGSAQENDEVIPVDALDQMEADLTEEELTEEEIVERMNCCKRFKAWVHDHTSLTVRNLTRVTFAGGLSFLGGVIASQSSSLSSVDWSYVISGSFTGGVGNAVSTWLAWEVKPDKNIAEHAKQLKEQSNMIAEQAKIIKEQQFQLKQLAEKVDKFASEGLRNRKSKQKSKPLLDDAKTDLKAERKVKIKF